jgi:uncharacterized protein (TIGR04376 family)
MGWWDELEASLTARLDDFLRANPDVAAEMERDTLAEQETQTRQLLQQLRGETQKLEQKILATGEQIRLWHGRLKLAEQAGRQDLIQAAKVRQGMFMTQGNQYWAELTVAKKRIQQLETLLAQIQSKRQQVQSQTHASPGHRTSEGVEREFRHLELEKEFEQLKRDMGRI